MGRSKKAGIHPTLHFLNNEYAAEVKDVITTDNMTYQLVTPTDHRRNLAKKAIQMVKDHFVSVLCGTDDEFPVKCWYQLLAHTKGQHHPLWCTPR